MRILQAITISCFLAGIGFYGFDHPGGRKYSKDQIHDISRSKPISVIPSHGIEKDVATSSNDSVGWLNLFPKDGLGRDFEFFTEDKTKRGKENDPSSP